VLEKLVVGETCTATTTGFENH